MRTLYLLILVTISTAFSMNQMPHLPSSKSTVRLHLCSNSTVTHYSEFNANKIVTHIHTPEFYIIRNETRLLGHFFVSYEGFNHKKQKKYSQAEAETTFNRLKLFFDLAEEPIFEEIYTQ